MFSDSYSTNKDDHQNLRYQTLIFFRNKFFDEHEFNKLEQLIKKSIYDTPVPCYANANLLDLLYNRRLIENLSTPKTRFGAMLSHGLKPEEGSILGIRPSIDLPDVIVNGWMIDKKRIKISPLLYKGNLYKIEFDPWIGNNQYKYELYNNVVKFYYDEHRTLFEKKNIFVNPSHLFYNSYGTDVYNKRSLIDLKKRIDSLRKKKSGFLIYLATCSYNGHLVTFVLTVKTHPSKPCMSARCYYFDMNKLYQRGVSLKKVTRVISTGIGIPIKYREMHPKVSLNFGMQNMFEFYGYCAVIGCIFINFLLQYLLQCDTMKEHASMFRILKKVYKMCLSMKKIKTVYEQDLWYYVVKNCAAAVFLRNYFLAGTKSFNDQSYGVIDIWSDSLFPQDYFDIFNMINTYNSESENRFKSFPTQSQNPFFFTSEDQLNKNCLKLSYAVANFDCVETLFGIVLYEDDDTTSLTDTLSSAVNDNRVDFYVINRLHYSAMFGTDNERGLDYETWLDHVTENKSDIQFAPMSGNSEEILWLMKEGIEKQNKMYTRFHIFGLKKNFCLTHV